MAAESEKRMGEVATVFGEHRLQETGENVSDKLEKQSCESECIIEDRIENIIKEWAAVTVEVLNQLNHNTGRNIQYFQHVSGL